MSALLAAGVVYARHAQAGQGGLHREGEFWVATDGGSESIGDGEQLKITCLGNVTVHGGAPGRIEYTVKRKFRARNDAQARDRLQDAGVSFAHQGRYTKLAVNDATGPVELTVSVPRKLSAILIGVDSGDIDVSDFDGAVNGRTAAGNIALAHVKGSVDVNTAGGSLRLGDIGGTARANTAGGDISADWLGGEALLVTAGGNITVQKTGARIRVATSGGTVSIGQAGGDAVAETEGGSIEIGRAAGTVIARNAGGGPIVVGSAQGNVRCDSAGGAIKVGAAAGAIRVNTAAGAVVVTLQGDRLPGDSYIATGSGDITVFLPSKFAVNIRAHNEGSSRSQTISSDFSGLRFSVDGGTVIAQGSINGGGPNLTIQGNSGMIQIKRK